MLQFSHEPPIESTRYAMRLLRTPAKGKLHLICVSREMTGCWTHYYAGRTVPCTGDGCEPCENGASSRWHAYVGAFDPTAAEILLFECTAAAAECFGAYKVKHGTLRACEFWAKRVAPRANARVHLTMKPTLMAMPQLPEEPNVQAALCHIWGIPITETDIKLGGDVRLNIAHKGTGLPVDRGNGDRPAA